MSCEVERNAELDDENGWSNTHQCPTHQLFYNEHTITLRQRTCHCGLTIKPSETMMHSRQSLRSLRLWRVGSKPRILPLVLLCLEGSETYRLHHTSDRTTDFAIRQTWPQSWSIRSKHEVQWKVQTGMWQCSIAVFKTREAFLPRTIWIGICWWDWGNTCWYKVKDITHSMVWKKGVETDKLARKGEIGSAAIQEASALFERQHLGGFKKPGRAYVGYHGRSDITMNWSKFNSELRQTPCQACRRWCNVFMILQKEAVFPLSLLHTHRPRGL